MRVEAARRLPSAVANARREVAVVARPAEPTERHSSPIARDHEALGGEATRAHLEPLHGGVYVARSAAGGHVLAHDVPGLQRGAKGNFHAVGLEVADHRNRNS